MPTQRLDATYRQLAAADGARDAPGHHGPAEHGHRHDAVDVDRGLPAPRAVCE